jgi:membrane associated rhomboid family serine protease
MFFPLGDDNSGRHITPVVVYGLIAVNVLVFLVQMTAGDSFTNGWATIPREITNGIDLVQTQSITIDGQRYDIPQAPGPTPIYLTLFSAMFMHGGFMHIAGNMLYLWIFGDNIENLLGHLRFLIFYLLCGLAASLAFVFANTESVIPSLGASGAIAGVLGGYLVKYPRNSVRVLFMNAMTNLPAFVVLGGWIALQIFAQVGESSGAGKASGVAYLAHIGGFVAGVVLVFVFGIGRGASPAPQPQQYP